jgi:periplasmic copper chaperone A
MLRILTLLTTSYLFSQLVFAQSSVPITVKDAWIAETPPGVQVNAAYMTIENSSSEDIILTSANSPDFQTIEIHLSVIKDGKASMQKQDTIRVKANSQFSFSPSGYHFMLFKAVKTMRAGDLARLNLQFENEMQIPLSVQIRKHHSTHTHH